MFEAIWEHRQNELTQQTSPEGIEIMARREALGMTQNEFAAWLPWKQSRVSEVERGRRAWPGWAEARLIEAEGIFQELAGSMYAETLEQIKAGTTVGLIRTGVEATKGVPKCVHRAAAVVALLALRAQDRPARIIE